MLRFIVTETGGHQIEGELSSSLVNVGVGCLHCQKSENILLLYNNSTTTRNVFVYGEDLDTFGNQKPYKEKYGCL